MTGRNLGPAWNDWAGGACPVGFERTVEVRYRNPRRMMPSTKIKRNLAGVFRWAHTGEPDDIIAWRGYYPPVL